MKFKVYCPFCGKMMQFCGQYEGFIYYTCEPCGFTCDIKSFTNDTPNILEIYFPEITEEKKNG